MSGKQENRTSNGTENIYVPGEIRTHGPRIRNRIGGSFLVHITLGYQGNRAISSLSLHLVLGRSGHLLDTSDLALAHHMPQDY